MAASSADHNDIHILRAARHRHRVPIRKLRRTDWNKPSVPYHWNFMHGAEMDVLSDHVLSIPGILQHHPMIRSKGDNKRTGDIGVV